MGGLRWRVGVLALVLCAWGACSAQELVNLVQPQVGRKAPQGPDFGSYQWQACDGDTSTFFETGRTPGIFLRWPRSRTIRPIVYRIILAADVEPKDYPSSWAVRRNNIVVRRPVDAVFTNGVYEGTLPGEINVRSFSIEDFNKDRVKVAEIELLGTREALDLLWAPGPYPCSERTVMVTDKKGPRDVFLKANGIKKRATGREKEFFTAGGDNGVFYYGGKSIFFVVYLPATPMVREVIIYSSTAREGVVLLGNRCEPNCDKYGSKGWVRLATGSYDIKEDATRIFVENPGEYKAYRVKFPYRGVTDRLFVDGIYFLGCRS